MKTTLISVEALRAVITAMPRCHGGCGKPGVWMGVKRSTNAREWACADHQDPRTHYVPTINPELLKEAVNVSEDRVLLGYGIRMEVEKFDLTEPYPAEYTSAFDTLWGLICLHKRAGKLLVFYEVTEGDPGGLALREEQKVAAAERLAAGQDEHCVQVHRQRYERMEHNEKLFLEAGGEHALELMKEAVRDRYGSLDRLRDMSGNEKGSTQGEAAHRPAHSSIGKTDVGQRTLRELERMRDAGESLARIHRSKEKDGGK